MTLILTTLKKSAKLLPLILLALGELIQVILSMPGLKVVKYVTALIFTVGTSKQ